MIIKNQPIRLSEIEFKSDYEFSQWLKSKGYKGDYVKHNTKIPSNTFIDTIGNFICTVKYDNTQLNYTVYIGAQ